jgi:hypothetical protein
VCFTLWFGKLLILRKLREVSFFMLSSKGILRGSTKEAGMKAKKAGFFRRIKFQGGNKK